MYATPEDEVEGSTMPEATEEHGHEEIKVLAEFAVTVASHGDVKIVLEPGGEADVPTTPELCDGLGFVRTVKILGKLESEQEGNADGHVGVAREVAVNLEGVSIDSKEVLKTAVKVGLIENALYEVDGDVVGNDSLLKKSSDDEKDTCAEHLVGNEERTAYLGDEVTGTNNRTCHELGEETDVEGIVKQTVEGLDVASVNVNRVTERLEGEE